MKPMVEVRRVQWRPLSAYDQRAIEKFLIDIRPFALDRRVLVVWERDKDYGAAYWKAYDVNPESPPAPKGFATN